MLWVESASLHVAICSQSSQGCQLQSHQHCQTDLGGPQSGQDCCRQTSVSFGVGRPQSGQDCRGQTSALSGRSQLCLWQTSVWSGLSQANLICVSFGALGVWGSATSHNGTGSRCPLRSCHASPFSCGRRLGALLFRFDPTIILFGDTRRCK